MGSANSPWRRRFRLYFAARTVSLLGDAMLPVGLGVAVLQAGYGASGVGYALAAWTAPIALLVVFGGVLADRLDPRRIMVAADLARVAVQSTMAVAFTTGTPALWQILCLQAGSGVATAMFQPGVGGLVPRVARDVQRGNAVLRTAEAVTTLLGPAFAGVLLALAGTGAVFAVDAATFGVSAACLLALRPAPLAAEPAGEGRGPVWRNLVDGWDEFRSRTWLWATILVWAMCGLLVFGPTLPLGAEVIISAHGSGGYGIVMSAFGGGTVLGGLVALRLRPDRPLAVGGIATATFALLPLTVLIDLPLWTIAAGHLVAGVGIALWGVLWATTVQTAVPAAVLNRVYAYDVAGSIMVLPVGRALAGPAASVFGVHSVLFAATCGAVLACTCMLAVPAIRDLRRAPEPAPVARVPG